MAMTAAERQRLRRSRIASNPERLAQYREKDRQRWKERRASGKIKYVKEMTDREHRNAKKYWRSIKAKQRKLHKTALEVASLTPPRSPDTLPSARPIRRSARANNCRKTRKVVSSLKEELENERKRAQKYKQRWLRKKSEAQADTPRKKTRKFLKHASATALQRKLVFHDVLISQLKAKYAADKQEHERREFCRMFSGALVKKYKLKHEMQKEVGISPFRRSRINSEATTSRKKYRCKSNRFVQEVTKFYIRDDNSRLTAGKKETKTFAKVKKQKRLLNLSLKDLHKKFLCEHPHSTLSYTLFVRLRPFWVVTPTEKDRQTCLCKVHENFEFAINKLHALKVLEFGKCDDLVKELTCDVDSKTCMYGQCETCRKPELPIVLDVDLDCETSWKKWVTKREEREIRGATKSVAFTVKDTVQGSLKCLIEEATEQFERYRKHTFNIVNQFRHGRLLRQIMKDDECIIHIDFSENYACKLTEEIQSMHFGASKRQITLHTGVYYIGPNSKAESFCTVSDSLHHGPAAIWAHLEPILDMICSQHKLSAIHFFSDGPCTQYRQKGNFYLFMKNMKEKKIKQATWNFSESGHGKGAPDGVGGAVKVSFSY